MSSAPLSSTKISETIPILVSGVLRRRFVLSTSEISLLFDVALAHYFPCSVLGSFRFLPMRNRTTSGAIDLQHQIKFPSLAEKHIDKMEIWRSQLIPAANLLLYHDVCHFDLRTPYAQGGMRLPADRLKT
jgi:hypothetical protein